MKNPTPANSVHVAPHLAIAMSGEIASVLTTQVMGDHRPEVSGCHSLPNYMTDMFPLTPRWGTGSVVISSSLNFKEKAVC